jgi:group II intron reverse transcriptase/maturase
MKPTMEILENISKNSKQNKDEVFTRLYRYLLRPDIYYVAYKNLYANSGASTKGIDNDTVDGFCEKKINNIIESLADGTYTPKPSRRTYIKKANGKMRPLGIPTFTDKLIQEALRMILEAVYEPVFLDTSHGFRPNRSCHTALKTVKYQFKGAKWFVEGDIKSCFDTINHSKLIEFINVKIKDARLIKLIWKLLKAGYVENWKYNYTHSGSPQGGVCSPIFSNIYLHELDKFVANLTVEFDQLPERKNTKEYKAIFSKFRTINRHLEKAEGDQRAELIKQKKILQKEQRITPCKSPTDKRLRYVRYADDFIIAICGNKEDCLNIKQKLSEFICKTMKMELSDEKTLITHSNTNARFLGYDIKIRRENKVKRVGINKNRLARVFHNKTELSVPFNDKIMKFLFENKIVKQKQSGEIMPTHRLKLVNCTDIEIISTFNAELRGICNYYAIASNFNKLNYFAYLMEYSCLLTLSAKYKSTIGKVRSKYKDGRGKWRIPYKTKMGLKHCYFADFMECKKYVSQCDTNLDTKLDIVDKNKPTRTTFESRLTRRICELCKTTTAENYEIHHVPKLKDLKGIEQWEKVMIAKRRKTLIVCESCHNMIHQKK